MLRKLVSAQRREHVSRDDGVALVAAISVAIIGVALTTLVVSQAIIVTNDASRDRVRTSEIHSAEGALDAALKEMETGLRCSPSFSPILVGEGTSQIEATVTIEYTDGTGDLTCDDEYLAGEATRARVTATGVAVNPGPGIEPVRTIQAEVRITPRPGLNIGSSLFANSTLTTENGGSVVPTDPNHPANIWVDSGNYNCINSFTLDGSVIVPDGGITMRNSCDVAGDAWAKTFFDVATSHNRFRVAGTTTVRDGNFRHENNNTFGGDLRVNGTVNTTPTVAGSICSTNVGSPCVGFEDFEKQGFPEVHYVPGDWPMTPKDISGWRDDILASGGLKPGNSDESLNRFSSNPCVIEKRDVAGPFHMSSTPSLYNLQDCDLKTEGVTLKVYSDTAIFVNSFAEGNGFEIESGDGGSYDVWIIVPWGKTGDIRLTNRSEVLPPVSLFLYTPGRIQIDNQQTISGQIYGQNVHISNNFTLNYVPMGIPGVDLGSSLTVTASGYTVEIEKKRELRQ
jgi:hypothetical protein